MLKTRTISAVILGAIMLICYIPGGFSAWLLTGAISLLSLIEFNRVIKMSSRAPAFVTYGGCAVYYAFLFPGFYNLWNVDIRNHFNPILFTVLFLIALCIPMVIVFPRYGIKDIMCAFFGFFYCVVMVSFVFMTRHDFYEGSGGIYFTALIFIASWICDIFAYFVGSKFGKHKLAPELSPHKSIEGAIGGTVGVFLFTCAYTFSCTLYPGINEVGIRDRLIIIGVTTFASVIAQVGDLTASAIKRNYNVKDYSNFIPGHGGVLDRFDSVIFVAPIIYYFLTWFL